MLGGGVMRDENRLEGGSSSGSGSGGGAGRGSASGSVGRCEEGGGNERVAARVTLARGRWQGVGGHKMMGE